ncbi:tRNA lysidine(34) synthetase TilS [Cognatishimia sp.]|uniref:tRNA lysidine(34) synthetase TilS n=1 Tax=Cognatishimia sp. TaxID=2211648 RepID=UPI00351347F7
MLDGKALLTSIAERVPAQGTLGVAVSGGGDSLALLLALHEIAEARGQAVEAMTVDHGLRAEAAAEADYTRKICVELGIPHATARWTGWGGEGNLQGAAREGRYRLIAEWAERRKLAAVCIGHTQDDVAETFVMRLGRESGVDGLARMADTFTRHDVTFLRPMLDIERTTLRDFLKRRGVEWCEDPSNENDDFDRVRVRRALDVLSDIGITSDKLASVAENMTQVRAVMRDRTADFATQVVTQKQGDLVLDRALFQDAPYELRRRLMNDALSWIAPTPYPLRRGALAELDQAISEGRNFSCNGCLIQVSAKSIRVLREFNAVRALVEFAPNWDRWSLSGPWRVGLKVAALGEPSLAGLDDWRASGVPRQSLMASPAVWKDDVLMAAPLANYGDGWSLSLREQDFHKFMTGSAYSH